MAFWNVDLTTQDGAVGAAQAGGLACFVAAGLTALGVGLLMMTQSATPPAEQAGAIVAIGIECVVFLVAGFRLRGGKGLAWGAAAAVLLAIEIAAKLATLNGLPGLVINVVLLAVIVNGVRGARALRGGALDGEAVDRVFE